MAQTIVKAESSRGTGSGPSRRLRTEGKLPGVLYGLGKDPISVAVAYNELRDALKGPQGMNTVFTLEVADNESETVIVRDVQRDPVKRVVTHADFLRVDPTKPVSVRVPLVLVGDETGVTNDGGLIEQNLFELEISALPLSVPTQIEADVSIMTLDRSISVADLNLPEGVESLIEEEISVASPFVPRAVEEKPVAAEGEDGAAADGEDGAAAEGEGSDSAGSSDEGSSDSE